MRTETKVVAWISLMFLGLSVVVLAILLPHDIQSHAVKPTTYPCVAIITALTVGWVGCLLARRWAWWTLVAVYGFICARGICALLRPIWRPGYDPDTTLFTIALLVGGFPLSALLIDPPRGWTVGHPHIQDTPGST